MIIVNKDNRFHASYLALLPRVQANDASCILDSDFLANLKRGHRLAEDSFIRVFETFTNSFGLTISGFDLESQLQDLFTLTGFSYEHTRLLAIFEDLCLDPALNSTCLMLYFLMKVRMQMANFDWSSRVCSLSEVSSLSENDQFIVGLVDLELFGGDSVLIDIGTIFPPVNIAAVDFLIGDHSYTYPILSFSNECITKCAEICDKFHLRRILHPVEFNWRPLTMVARSEDKESFKSLFLFSFHRRPLRRTHMHSFIFESPHAIVAHMQAFHARHTDKRREKYQVTEISKTLKQLYFSANLPRPSTYILGAIARLSLASFRPLCVQEMEAIAITAPGDLMTVVLDNLERYRETYGPSDLFTLLCNTYANVEPGEDYRTMSVLGLLIAGSDPNGKFSKMIARLYVSCQGPNGAHFLTYFCCLHMLVYVMNEPRLGKFRRQAGPLDIPFVRFL